MRLHAGVRVPRSYVVARDLMTLAWLEFLQTTSQDLKECPQWAALYGRSETQGEEGDAGYCSDKCQVAAYRARQVPDS